MTAFFLNWVVCAVAVGAGYWLGYVEGKKNR